MLGNLNALYINYFFFLIKLLIFISFLCNYRLINCNDELAISAYPQIVRLRPMSSKFCMICGVYNAQWITMKHERIPHNPCYFCDSCFKSYNYIDGKKVGNFEAYAYPRNIEAVKGKIDI